MGFIELPNLPKGRVLRAAMSGAFPVYHEKLEEYGVEVLPISPCDKLPGPVQAHADMLLHHLGGDQIIAADLSAPYVEALKKVGFQVKKGKEPKDKYPGDVGLNICRIGNYYIGKKSAMDPAVVKYAKRTGGQILTVGQGYAKCSTVVVGEKAAITADAGIAEACKHCGIMVLMVSPGYILLEGYDTGFIGGCFGLIAPDKMAVTGSLSSHPDGAAIRLFLEKYGVEPLELSDGPLLDVGSILPLTEA